MLDRVGDSKSDVGRSVVSGKLRIKIATAVEELPHDQREVFLMRQIQGMAFQDIADTVEVPLNTVKSRMRYALERLRAELGDYESYAKDMKI
jgi:RNA polymerase sigma-70 factor (ECF subfamily)